MIVGLDSPFPVSNAPLSPLSDVPCNWGSSSSSAFLLSLLVFRLRQTINHLMRHAARTSPTTAPIEPPMAAPCEFELDEDANELGGTSVAFAGEVVVVDVRRDVTLVVGPD